MHVFTPRAAWLPVLLVALLSQNLAGQLKLEPDEVVKVLHLNEWKDGVVIQKGKGQQYLVEYVFINARRDVFERHQIRKLYEYQGLDYGRMWKSDNGSFELEASLLRVKGDDVTLIKPDMDEITVPLERLSTRDQSYVKKFQRQFERSVATGQVPAPIPKLPEIETFADSSFGGFETFGSSQVPLQPFGKLPSFLREFKQNGVGFRLIRNRQDVESIVAVGGPEQWVLVNGREDNFANRGAPFQSQLYWLSMKQKRVTQAVAIPPEDLLLDYDPVTRMMLTFNAKKFADDEDDPSHMTIWRLGFGEQDPEALMRWNVTDMVSRHGFDVDFGKIISEDLILTKSEKNQYVGWDVKAKEVKFTIATKSFFGAPVRLTGDRKYLVVPEDGQISVFDAATGKVAMRVTVDARHVSGANIHPDGNRLCAVTEKSILIWDLESGVQEPTVYSAPLVGNPFRAMIDWIDDDKVLVEGLTQRILFSLELGMPLWSYQTSHRVSSREPLTSFVINGKLFYTDQQQGAAAIGVVELPGPGVAETTANVDPESLLALKPGVRVGLKLDGISSPGEVEGWLKQKIEDNGWIFDSSADIVLEASMGVGPSRTVEYSRFGSNETSATVTYQPHYSQINIKRGNQVLWRTGTSTGAPGVVRGDQAQIQSEINKYQKPNRSFFQSVKIDSKVIDPKYSRGFGVSKIGRQGIQVVSTNPPGRADDPAKEAEELEKERQAENEQRGNDTTEGIDGNSP